MFNFTVVQDIIVQDIIIKTVLPALPGYSVICCLLCSSSNEITCN